MRWKDAAAVVAVFVATLLICCVSYLHVDKPLPVICDEYANLLQADTYAHGRLANPPHPMAEHFEALHVLQTPTYAGKFPPGLPMLLALGQAIWHPLLGAWLSVAAGCAATCWMLLNWFRRGWSIVGALLLALLPIVHTWEVSYFGGGLAMLGGSLVCGAASRALREPRRSAGAIGAVGSWILFNSRPFEGAILVALLTVIAAIHIACRRQWFASLMRQTVLTAAIVSTPLLAANMYYNFRVTGSALTLPYALHARQYMVAPLMWWQSPHTPTRSEAEPLKTFHSQIEFDEYAHQRSWSGWLAGVHHKSIGLFEQYIAPLWIVPALLLSLLAWRTQAVRWAWMIWMLLPLIHFSMTPWLRWNYMAPIVGLMAAAVVAGLEQLWRFQIRRLPAGAIAAMVITGCIVVSSLRWAWAYDAVAEIPIIAFRQVLIDRLTEAGGEHLVLVEPKTDPDGFKGIDIVYNPADIDKSAVIFARDLGTDKNRELIAYYSRRRAWLVDPITLQIRAYPPG